MSQTNYVVWKRSDNYVGTSTYTPKRDNFTFEIIGNFSEWEDALHELLSARHADHLENNCIKCWRVERKSWNSRSH